MELSFFYLKGYMSVRTKQVFSWLYRIIKLLFEAIDAIPPLFGVLEKLMPATMTSILLIIGDDQNNFLKRRTRLSFFSLKGWMPVRAKVLSWLQKI